MFVSIDKTRENAILFDYQNNSTDYLGNSVYEFGRLSQHMLSQTPQICHIELAI